MAEDRCLLSLTQPIVLPVGTTQLIMLSFQEARFSFLGGKEPQMIFDWVDVESRGRLSLEEFSSGLSTSVLGGSWGLLAHYWIV